MKYEKFEIMEKEDLLTYVKIELRSNQNKHQNRNIKLKGKQLDKITDWL